jgi:putative flippase GtrA
MIEAPSKWNRAGKLARQWLKFNAIGAIGIMVQLAVLTLLTHGLRMNYLLATLFGVEAAVLHNFIWHERWTWSHAARGGPKDTLIRLLKFNFTTGIFSIFGNLFFMRIFVGSLRVPVLPANLVTIAACNLLNFTVSHYFVFGSRRLQQ